jgi:FAD synthase
VSREIEHATVIVVGHPFRFGTDRRAPWGQLRQLYQARLAREVNEVTADVPLGHDSIIVILSCLAPAAPIA